MVDANGNPIPCQPIEFNHVRIIPPEGYEIDKENSTFENIIFKKKYVDCYESILKELFSIHVSVYGENPGTICNFEEFIKNHKNKIVLNKRENYKRLVALTKLINVAEYLNQGEKGNAYLIYIDSSNKIRFCLSPNTYGQVCFCTELLARRAVDILGEETIKLEYCKYSTCQHKSLRNGRYYLLKLLGH